METKVSNFRTWKSGKVWLVASAAVAALAMTGAVTANAATVNNSATTTNGAGTVPVYQVAKGNDHYLSTNKAYVDSLLTKGYNSEKIVAFAAAQSATPVNSWYKPSAGHYYTTDNSAANVARLKALGYTQFYTSNLYSLTANDNNAAPVYVTFNSAANHYYTQDQTDVPAGYGNQSVSFLGVKAAASIAAEDATVTAGATNAQVEAAVVKNAIAAGTTVTVNGVTSTLAQDELSADAGGNSLFTNTNGVLQINSAALTVTGLDTTKTGVQTVTLALAGSTTTTTVKVTVVAPTVSSTTGAVSTSVISGANANIISATNGQATAYTLNGSTASETYTNASGTSTTVSVPSSTLNVATGTAVDPYVGLILPKGGLVAAAAATSTTAAVAASPAADQSVLYNGTGDTFLSDFPTYGQSATSTTPMTIAQMKAAVSYTWDDVDAKTTGNTGTLDTTKLGNGDIITIHYFTTGVNGVKTPLATAKLTVMNAAVVNSVAPAFKIDTTKDTLDTTTGAVDGTSTTAAVNGTVAGTNTLTLGQTVLGATTFDPASFTTITKATGVTETIIYAATTTAAAQGKADVAAAQAANETLATYIAANYTAKGIALPYAVVSSVDTTKVGTYTAYYTQAVKTAATYVNGVVTLPTTALASAGSLTYNIADAGAATVSASATAARLTNGTITVAGYGTLPVVLVSSTSAANYVAYAPSSYLDAKGTSTMTLSNNTGTLTAVAPASQTVANPYAPTSEAVTVTPISLGALSGTSSTGTAVSYSNVTVVAYTYAGSVTYVAFATK